MKTVDLALAQQVPIQGHTSKGDQPKWQVKNNWYKADHMGYEALTEVLAARMLTRSTIANFVNYEPVLIETEKGTLRGCSSRNFRQKHETLVPLERLHRAYHGEGLAKTLVPMADAAARIRYTVGFVEEITGLTEFAPYLATMLELDAFLLNEDRHTNNIALIRDDTTGIFRLCPYFDHGLSLLSDLNDYPMDMDIYMGISKVRAKPFAERFEEQLEAAQLYGSSLKFQFARCDVDVMLKDLTVLYDEATLARAKQIILEQMRRYRYLF